MERRPYYPHEAEDEAKEMQEKIKKGEAKTYTEAERIINNQYLKEALSEIVGNYLSNARFHLDKIGEIGIGERLFDVSIKESIDFIANGSKTLENNYSDGILSFVAGIIHDLYKVYLESKKRNLKDRPFVAAFARLSAKTFEMSEYSFFNAASLYEDLGDKDKSESLLKIARENQANGTGTTGDEHFAKLVRLKSEFLAVLKDFLEEVENDPAMAINANAVIEDVKSEIENKLKSN